MASLSRATNVMSANFAKESALVAGGYSLTRIITEIVRAEVVDLQVPGAHAVYSFFLAGMVKMFVGGRKANLVALGMVANGVSSTWNDLTE